MNRGHNAAAIAFSLTIAVSACATTPASPAPAPAVGAVADSAVEEALVVGRLPEVDSVIGPLDLRVVYPAEGAVIQALDSTFMFGSTGSGDARLTINGAPVAVAPNGAWLAWVALPPDSVMRFELHATTPRDAREAVLTARRPRRFHPPVTGPWVDTSSLSPAGPVVMPEHEPVELRVRASPGATVALVLADGSRIPFATETSLEAVPWGVRAFGRDTAALRRSAPNDRYVGLLAEGALSGDSASAARVEVVMGTDTLRVPWPLSLARIPARGYAVELDDDVEGTGNTDGIVIGRALPGGTYHWFWPNGTRARATGRLGADLRLELAPGVEAWVPARETRPLPGQPAPRPVVGSLTMRESSEGIAVRIPLGVRAPYEVIEHDSRLDLVIYGGVGDVNWIRYGSEGDLVRRAAWSQADPRGVVLGFELAQPVWGFRTRWDRDDLILEIRRPPEIDRGAPLEGLKILVDPGHPPGGATGPTGLREAEANLGVALALRPMLEREGAQVVMTRTTDAAVALGERPRLAESLNADLLISIHNNALPDGVNPFSASGTSVFYNHPRSIPLARAVQAGLVQQLGVRDLGFGRGDLALVRPTWMPAILTEGLFMMVPEQEAALRSEEGRRRYAAGVLSGVRTFLRERAADQ
ncbi:MAG TPA: N-acetylmuramoyl-L-alanine amidase [Gemmatimonadales bacterium]|nr:N-acetylmuramoyl-L-alanine amidase [Gemmatimonadales bacterium]